MKGRTTQNKVVVFDIHPNYKIGDYASVKITGSITATLFGDIVQEYLTTNIPFVYSMI